MTDIQPQARQKSWLVDEAYAALRQAILANDYPPGHHLSAQELAERLGMSRTPVQEAALRLQQEDLLEILPKRGIRIKALTRTDLAEIYDVLIALESRAAELIAELPDTERRQAVADLSAANDAMSAAVACGDIQRWAVADADFHRLLITHAGNRRFAAMVATVNAQAHRARTMTAPLRADLAASVAEHAAIIAAIDTANAANARAAAGRHRTNARDEMVPLLDRLGLKRF